LPNQTFDQNFAKYHCLPGFYPSDHPAGYRVHQVQVSPIAATGQLHESRHKATEAWTFLAKIAAGKGPMNYRTARATECTFGKTSSKKKG
jgi:hypothetical protein